MKHALRRPIAAAAMLGVGLITALSATAGGAAIAASRPVNHEKSAAAEQMKVAFMVPGALGDLGFFDSAEAGMKEIGAKLGDQIKTVEGGVSSTATWVRDLQELSTGSYNIVVTGSASVQQQLQQVAKQFPHQHYIMFDDTVDLPNVATILYRQNDGAFLAGVLAGLVADNPKLFPNDKGTSKTVGIIGGLDIPVIQDFVVGFVKGAHAVDPSIKVLTSYVGSFVDPQTAYNQATDMFNRGAAVVFAAAGGSGLGALKASNVMHRYSIGVDSNENNIYPKNVLASDLKQVGTSVFDLVKLAGEGKLQYGKTYIYGLQNNGVGLVDNNALVPASIGAKLASYAAMVKSGKIVVPCVQPYCAAAGTATNSAG